MATDSGQEENNLPESREGQNEVHESWAFDEGAIDYERPETDEEMEGHRQAWTEALASGAIRFYRRPWHEFEGNFNREEEDDDEADAATSPVIEHEAAAWTTGEGQHLQSVRGEEVQQGEDGLPAIGTAGEDVPQAGKATGDLGQ